MFGTFRARILFFIVAAHLCSLGSAQCDFRFAERFALNTQTANGIHRVIAEPASFGNRLYIALSGSTLRLYSWTDASLPGFSEIPSSFARDFGFVELGAMPGLYNLSADASLILRLSRHDGTSWVPVGPDLGFNMNGRIFVIRENGVDEIYIGMTGVTGSATGAPRILHWTGSAFVQVGPPLASSVSGATTLVNDLVRYDDGNGAVLVAAVTLAAPQRLVGNTWQPMSTFSGTAASANDLHVIPNNGSEELWAGGFFTVPGGSNLAKWTGSGWQPMGQPDSLVDHIAHFDGPNGREIFVAGLFSTIGGQSISRSARLLGTTWSAIPGRNPNSKDRFISRVVNQTPTLDAVSYLNGHASVYHWNGQALVASEGDGVTDSVFALARHDDGTGEKLWIGGSFHATSSAEIEGIAVYDGDRLSSPGGAMVHQPFAGGNVINALFSFRPGETSSMIAGGKFDGFDTPTGFQPINSIASWDGASWSALGAGIKQSAASSNPGTVYAMEMFDAGFGPELFVGGSFGKAGDVNANNIAAWNGVSWRAVDSGTSGPVYSLKVYNGQLFVGGKFTSAGTQVCNGFARSNGITFTSVGGGLSAPFYFVNAMHVHPLGGTERLIVGGYFTSIEGFSASSIAAYDGTAWSSLGIGIADPIFPVVGALTTFDEGDGPALFVGGLFWSAGGAAASRIARYKDGTWSPLGTGMSNANAFVGGSPAVWALSSFRDPRGGDALHLGGFFGKADGIYSNHLAAFEADPQSNSCPILGPAARSAVGESAGGPFDVLKVQGRVGNGHRVNVGIGEPIEISLDQPSTVPFSTGFVLYSRIGAAGASDVMPLPLGLGDFAFTPCSFDPGNPDLFLVASDFALTCQPLAPAGGTPWSLAIPGGIGLPFDFTLQGFVGDLSATYGISKTNAVLVVVR